MKTLDMDLLEESKKADAEAEAKARYVVQCIKYAIKDPSRADKLRDALGEIDYAWRLRPSRPTTARTKSTTNFFLKNWRNGIWLTKS